MLRWWSYMKSEGIHGEFFAVHGNRVYYSRSKGIAGDVAASIGCIELSAP